MKSKTKFAKISTKHLVLLSMLVAVAMILSYIESFIPAFVAIPGVKLGLSNIASVFALYILGAPAAFAVSLVRVFLSCLLFGNISTLIYSLLGAVLSLVSMSLLRKAKIFSVTGVSVVGGVFHNVGQIIAAVIMVENAALVMYLPVLILSGTFTGTVIGLISGIAIEKIKKTKLLNE